MGKRALVVNVAVWGAVLVASAAFQVWYRTVDAETTWEVLASSSLAQGALALSGPLALFSLGALLALLVVRLRRLSFGRAARNTLRAVGVLTLALFVLAAVPVLVPDAGGPLMFPVVVVVYLAVVAPVLFAVLGFLYGLGCAPVDKSRRGPFAKYLPEDHFE